MLQQKQGRNAQVSVQVWAWAVQPVSTYYLLMLIFTLFLPAFSGLAPPSRSLEHS